MTNVQLLRSTIDRYQDRRMPIHIAKRCMAIIYDLPAKSRKKYFRKLEDCLRIQYDESADLHFSIGC